MSRALVAAALAAGLAACDWILDERYVICPADASTRTPASQEPAEFLEIVDRVAQKRGMRQMHCHLATAAEPTMCRTYAGDGVILSGFFDDKSKQYVIAFAEWNVRDLSTTARNIEAETLALLEPRYGSRMVRVERMRPPRLSASIPGADEVRCTTEAKTCPEGSVVWRDPALSCQFRRCACG